MTDQQRSSRQPQCKVGDWELHIRHRGSAGAGRPEETRSEVQARLALNPKFTAARFREGAQSDNPVFLKQRERIIEGTLKAGLPEG